MGPARPAVTTISGKAIGPVGYGMLSKYLVNSLELAI